MGHVRGPLPKGGSKASPRKMSYDRVGKEDTPRSTGVDEEIASKIDPVKFAVDWGDSSVSSLLYSRGIFNFTEGMMVRLPDFVANFTRKRLDDISYLIFDRNKLEGFYEEYQTSQHKNVSSVAIALKLSLMPVKASKKLLQLLLVTGAVHGAAAGSAVPVIGSVLAVGAWLSLTFSTYKLAHDIRVRGSYAFWLADEMNKYRKHETVIKFMDNRIQLIKAKIANPASAEQKEKLEKKLKIKTRKRDQLVEKRDGIKQKMIYIAQVKKSKSGRDKHRDNLVNRMCKILGVTNEEGRKDLLDQINQKPTPQVEALVRQLRKNQRDKVISRSIGCAATALIALGGTLTAISPVCAHAAPAVLGVGIGLSLAGLTMQIGKFAIVKSVNLTSKIAINMKEKKLMIEEYKKYGLLKHPGLAGLSPDKQFQYRLSFEHSLTQLRKEYQGLTDTVLEKKWYESINKMDIRKQRRLLASAEDLGIRNHKLVNVLKLHDMTMEKQKTFISTLTNQDINSIINRYNRTQLMHSAVKKMTPSMFFNKPDEKQRADANKAKLSRKMDKELQKKYGNPPRNLKVSYRKI